MKIRALILYYSLLRKVGLLRETSKSEDYSELIADGT